MILVKSSLRVILTLFCLFICVRFGRFASATVNSFPNILTDNSVEIGNEASANDPMLNYYLARGLMKQQAGDVNLADNFVGQLDNNGNFYYLRGDVPASYQYQVSENPDEGEELVDYLNRRLQSGDQLRLETDANDSTYLYNMRNKKLNNLFGETGSAEVDYISAPINNLQEYKFKLNNNTFDDRDALLSVYMSNMLKKLNDDNNRVNDLIQQQDDEQDARRSALFDLASGNNLETGKDEPESRYGNSEYIDHPLALMGHQYVQGGAGEGRQLLGPEGTFENVQVIKTDHGVPSYCNPPNPCPIGYTAEDGCLEKFVNSASFSREYQAKQKCSCDNEHSLFNCASAPINNNNNINNNNGNSLMEKEAGDLNPLNSLNGDQEASMNVLARTIENRFGNLASVRNLINEQKET